MKRINKPIQAYQKLIEYDNRTYDRVKTFRKHVSLLSEDENEPVDLLPGDKEKYLGLLSERAESLKICSATASNLGIDLYRVVEMNARRKHILSLIQTLSRTYVGAEQGMPENPRAHKL